MVENDFSAVPGGTGLIFAHLPGIPLRFMPGYFRVVPAGTAQPRAAVLHERRYSINMQSPYEKNLYRSLTACS